MTDPGTTDDSCGTPPTGARQDAEASLDAAPRCLNCNYILIGLPGHRCPECGTTIDWKKVWAAARDPGLPIDRRHGWGRITGGLLTWLLVLFRPRTFARQVSERKSVWPATAFAFACIACTLPANRYLGVEPGDWRDLAAWAVGIWFHIEGQSFLFFLIDIRRGDRSRQWSLWRKVSLYTTSFVVLDWVAGPPIFGSYLRHANFPWILDAKTWNMNSWLPSGSTGASEILRGVAYYWWMIVLMITVWTRMRRKWPFLIILALMPVITALAFIVSNKAWDLMG